MDIKSKLENLFILALKYIKIRVRNYTDLLGFSEEEINLWLANSYNPHKTIMIGIIALAHYYGFGSDNRYSADLKEILNDMARFN